jgi:hypothetical protein
VILRAIAITKIHDECTAAWHTVEGITQRYTGLELLIVNQHLRNIAIWHKEDFARVPDVSDREIADTKRSIDRLNQERNDLAEQIDTTLLTELTSGCEHYTQAELHSESPGLMIDRLSVLALKIYHTQQELLRSDCTFEHVERNARRLSMLTEQRSDLERCFDRLCQECIKGTRRFKIYHQLKMYNDPTLNPQLYGSKRSAEARGGTALTPEFLSD